MTPATTTRPGDRADGPSVGVTCARRDASAGEQPWSGRSAPQPGGWRQRREGRRDVDTEPGGWRQRREGRRDVSADRGGASVLLLAIGMVFVLVGGFGAAIGAARLARHQARVGADFGALAGAGQVWRGVEPACTTAGEFVRANAARLVACQVDGLDVVVTVEVAVTPLPGLRRYATATARAGPVRG
ncbi:Rv3654c family TadE-like protein [Micromonospora rifamycinica]|uniref:Rv3654c family TadE-like protein n=1 Tax=Micromonospora rifamycinica TaxID=291594 RepID=UPI0033FE8163